MGALGCAHAPSAAHRDRPFPDLVLQDPVGPDLASALGVASPQRVRLSEIPGDVLLLEFFNSRCPTCRMQAPQMEEAFRAVASEPYAGRVRVIAVGAGDLRRDLEAFQRDQRTSYPLVPDPWYDLLGRLGSVPRTPVTLFLRRQEGRWVQVDALQGRVAAAALLTRAKSILEGDVGQTVAATGEAAEGFHPPLGLDQGEQRARALALLSGIDPSVRDVEVLELGGGIRVFRAHRADGKAPGLYARIASREPPCDVCHAVHFLLAFDDAGNVRGFEPIHVTKVGNQPLSPDEEALLRSRLVGRKLQEPRFEPTVDSVTGATLSASVIFDEARRTARLLSHLRDR
jgi:thiol-disulfide isomerase/thioredoxin